MSRPFCSATTITGRPSNCAKPATIAGSSPKCAVAVDLLKIGKDALDVIQGMRPLGMPRKLNPPPCSVASLEKAGGLRA